MRWPRMPLNPRITDWNGRVVTRYEDVCDGY